MRKKEKQLVILLFAIAVLVIIYCLFVKAKVEISPGRGFGRNTYTSKDTTLIADRHMGYVNFNRFSELMKQVCVNGTTIEENGDSAYFSVNKPQRLFGQNYKDDESWIRQYKNLPITVTDKGFNARLETIDSVVYVYIPYQILSNMAKLTKGSAAKNEGVDNEERETLKRNNKLPTSVMDGKIQIEGIVRQNVVDILSSHPNLDQEEQLEALWRYAKNNWNYMNDPYSVTDTWRPADETINDYYFVNGKSYTGDCDDFAILMASFARQIGFPTAFIAAYRGNEGHAYAEYYNGKKWIPMDWFSKELGGKPYQGNEVVVIYRDKV